MKLKKDNTIRQATSPRLIKKLKDMGYEPVTKTDKTEASKKEAK